MPVFGKRSMSAVMSCSRDMQTINFEAIKETDYSALEGYRSSTRSFELFKKGRRLIHPTYDKMDPESYEIVGNVVTKVDGFKVRSQHNNQPSPALDIAPYPIDWDSDEIHYLQELIKKGDRPLKEIIKAVSRISQVRGRFYFLQGVIHATASRLYRDGKIKHLIRGGHDWDRDGDFTDQNFDDLGHIELYTPKKAIL